MKRSIKELQALESAYKICCLVEEQSANVLAEASQYDDTEADIANNNRCIEFNNWYLSMLERSQIAKKK